MGGTYDRHALLRIELPQDVQDALSCCEVKIASWLVTQQHCGSIGQCPRDCHALLLSARHLDRAVIPSVSQTDEFQEFRGTSMYAWLFATTPADLLWAEPDVAWMQAGGASPVAWIGRLAGRIPAIHLKDYTWEAGGPRFCELGRGNLDWDGIFTALNEAQVPIWIVEQDDPVPERDIFASVALSLEFLHQRRVL